MFQKSASQYYDKTTGRKGYDNGAILNTDVIYKPKAEVKKEAAKETQKKKEIKESDIAAKAQAAGQTVDNYRKILIQNGVKIIK
jgi:hypothetical protein